MTRRRIISALILLTLLLSMMPAGAGAEANVSETSSFVDGTKGSEWTILNEVNEGHMAWRLIPGRGLRLMSQPSGMQTGFIPGTMIPSIPQNVFMRPMPTGDWEAIAKVFYPVSPMQNFQQIAFGVYDDQNNYLKLNVESNGAGAGARRAQFSIMRNGVYAHTHFTNLNHAANFPAGLRALRVANLAVWYRIEKVGNVYTGSVSFNGVDFVTVGSGTGVGTSATSGQYEVAYTNPRFYVAAINDHATNVPLETFVEYVKIMPAAEVPASAFNDVVSYVTNAFDFAEEVSPFSIPVGGRATFPFQEFPLLPYGHTYSFVVPPANQDMFAINDGIGGIGNVILWGRQPGVAQIELQMTDGVRTHTLRTITAQVTPATRPVITFNYNYAEAPPAPPSFVRIVGEDGRLDAFPVEQTLPGYGSRANFGFIGWFTTPTGEGRRVRLDEVFTTSANLYARWEENPSLWREFEEFFLMGAFQDFIGPPDIGPYTDADGRVWPGTRTPDPMTDSNRGAHMRKHYNINCPVNAFKLDSMLDVPRVQANFQVARNRIMAEYLAGEICAEERDEQLQYANEQIYIFENPTGAGGLIQQLDSLQAWNRAVAYPASPHY